MVQDFGSLMRRRRSIRAYLDKPVPRAEIEEICRLARTAPSGANLQPGRFHVLTGTPLRNLISGIDAAIGAGVAEATEYSWIPEPKPPEVRQRQRGAGYAAYQPRATVRR